MSRAEARSGVFRTTAERVYCESGDRNLAKCHGGIPSSGSGLENKRLGQMELIQNEGKGTRYAWSRLALRNPSLKAMSKSKTSPDAPADSTVEDLKALLREAEQALGEAGGDASDQFQALRERLRGAFRNDRFKIKEIAAVARGQVARADELVHEKPYAALGIAAAAGFVVGYLVCQRRSD